MKVLIIGAGEVGYTTAQRLAGEGHDVVVIEADESRAHRVGEELDVQVISGSGSDPEVLKQAGLSATDLVIAVTNRDEVNLVSCTIAKAYGPQDMKTVARVRLVPLASDTKVARQFGIDLVINPERSAAQRILDAVSYPGVSELVRFSGGRLVVAGIHLDRDLPYLGHTLQELGKNLHISALIGAAVKNGEVIIPRGDYVLEKDTLLYVITTPEQLAPAVQFLLPDEKRVNYAAVAGGSYLASYLCARMAEQNIRVKLIENDRRRAFEMANSMPGVLVLHGDPMDMDLFEEEGLDSSDIFIAATPSDETNVLSALLAVRAGVDSSAVLIRNHNLAMNVSRMDSIDVILNPRHAAVDAVLQFVRRGRVHQVTSFPRAENAELMEVEVLDSSKIAGKPLRDCNLPEGVLIGAIIRDDEVIIPRGNDVLRPNDRVLIITLHHAIPQVEMLIREGM